MKTQSSAASFAPGMDGLLAPLDDFLNDEVISEILINRPHEVFIEKHGQFHRFDMPILTTQYLRRLFTFIANENKQIISETHPILSGQLNDGSRVQLVMPPAARFETLSIRKFSKNLMSFEDYAANGFFNLSNKQAITEDTLISLHAKKNWHLFLKEAILAKKNILISGATSSGKTTFLNSCIAQIPSHERLITLEDTYEIKLNHPNCVQLKTLKSLSHQASHVTMQDLVQASLRLRPDRIIMGEIRGCELFDFVSACSTGHSGALATIHANNPKVAFMRMVQLYKMNPIGNMQDEEIYQILHEVIDGIVQLEKTDAGRGIVDVYYKDAIA